MFPIFLTLALQSVPAPAALSPLAPPPAAISPASGARLPVGVRGDSGQSDSSQTVTERAILAAEYARHDSSGVLARAVQGDDIRLRKLAIRALGRIGNVQYAPVVIAQLRNSDPGTRLEAVNALGNMRSQYDLIGLLNSEKDSGVRSMIYERAGRQSPASVQMEEMLVAGLNESDTVREGVARGLESYMRRTVRITKHQAASIAKIRSAFLSAQNRDTRQLLLLALNTAGDKDPDVIASALSDPDAQLRRLGVLAAERFVRDTSAMVRLEGVRFIQECEALNALFADPVENVAVAAINAAGRQNCNGALLASMADTGSTLRLRASALVALARVSPAEAAARLPGFMSHPVWQARSTSAQAARILNDSAALAKLAHDSLPMVALTAINSIDDALRAMMSEHAGLALQGVLYIKSNNLALTALPQLLELLDRLNTSSNITYRDVKGLALMAIESVPSDTTRFPVLRRLVSGKDPQTAALAAGMLKLLTGAAPDIPPTAVYTPPAFPDAAWDGSLRGATAVINVRGLGEVRLKLLADEAPVTVATFAKLAEAGRFNGLTFHRIVPNFVIQGGSPGADEYDGLTTHFMRDEVGLVRHERGTVGISTRGRDTGDGQIFINLVDNHRLNHDYTVFARVTDGMSLVDRVTEYTIIDSVTIQRALPGKK